VHVAFHGACPFSFALAGGREVFRRPRCHPGPSLFLGPRFQQRRTTAPLINAMSAGATCCCGETLTHWSSFKQSTGIMPRLIRSSPSVDSQPSTARCSFKCPGLPASTISDSVLGVRC
jgi:hypothetical protein